MACIHNIDDPEKLKDADFNIQKAREIYDESLEKNGDGFLPWGAYTDKRYLDFLPWFYNKRIIKQFSHITVLFCER